MNTFNNKVVYAALVRMTNDREVIKQAFVHWHGKFAHKPLDVFAYVEAIERYLGLDTGEKKVLMVSMHAASSKNESSLRDVPEYIFGSGSEPNSGNHDAVEQGLKHAPHVSLTEQYYSNLLDGLSREGGRYVHEFESELKNDGFKSLERRARKALRKADEDGLKLPSDLDEAACKALCHELYLLLCDVAGPMVADDLTYKSIEALLETTEARRYDPRDLI